MIHIVGLIYIQCVPSSRSIFSLEAVFQRTLDYFSYKIPILYDSYFASCVALFMSQTKTILGPYYKQW